MWQDTLVACGSIFFAVSLLPELRDARNGNGMNVFSATMTSVILFMYCIAYYTVGMYLAAIPITASIWALIAYYSWRSHATPRAQPCVHKENN